MHAESVLIFEAVDNKGVSTWNGKRRPTGQRVEPCLRPVDVSGWFDSVSGRGMKNETVSRFSISLPPSLLQQLDEMTREKGYDNRSLAIADMIRDRLVEHQEKTGKSEMVGTITLVYDHHKPHLQASLTDIQHDYNDVILSTVHVHLDHHNCLEVLLVRGKADLLRKIADELISAKGVKHGKLSVTTTGKDLPP